MTQSFERVLLSPTMRRMRFLGAVFPVAMFAGLDAFAGRLVAKLHVIHARRNAGFENQLDGRVLEMVVVHQSAVADGAVHDLDFRAVGEPAAGGVVFVGSFGGFHGYQFIR